MYRYLTVFQPKLLIQHGFSSRVRLRRNDGMRVRQPFIDRISKDNPMNEYAESLDSCVQIMKIQRGEYMAMPKEVMHGPDHSKPLPTCSGMVLG